MPKDRVQREIEEILDKLDTFVPEERFTAKMRARRKAQTEASDQPSLLRRITKPFTSITLGHLLILGLVLFAVSYIFGDRLGSAAVWMTVAGVVLAGGALLVSIINGGNTRIRVGGENKVQKRWRGQVIEYNQPGPVDRFREWWRRRRNN